VDGHAQLVARSRLWAIVVASAVLIAIILSLGYLSNRTREQEAFRQFSERELVLARAAGAGIDVYFETIARDVGSLRHGPHSLTSQEREMRGCLDRVYRQLKPLGVNDVAMLDANGVVKYTFGAPQIEGKDFSWRRYYQQAREATSSDTYFLEFIEFKGVEAGEKGVLLAVPLFDPEDAAASASPRPARFAGVAVATLRLDVLTQRLVSHIRPSPMGRAYLFDDRLTVLWAPSKSLFGKNMMAQAKGFPAFQQTLKRMQRGTNGTGEYSYLGFDPLSKEYDRPVEECLIGFAPVRAGSGLWFVGVWAPTEDARELIASSYRAQLLQISLIALVIVAGAGYTIISYRQVGAMLASEVETKTAELKKSESRYRGLFAKQYAIAEALQESLLRPVPAISGVDVGIIYAPASSSAKVGGDFYDVFLLGGDRVAILVGDVSGKGVEAAGTTETIRSSVRALASVDSNPSFVLSHVNDALVPQIPLGGFVTAIFMVWDRTEGQIAVANAGHPPPLIIGEDCTFAPVQQELLLGVFPHQYSVSNFDFSEGQTLFLYTDGLIETREGDSVFGLERLLEAACEATFDSAQDLVDQMLAAASAYSSGELEDDIVMVAIRPLRGELKG